MKKMILVAALFVGALCTSNIEARGGGAFAGGFFAGVFTGAVIAGAAADNGCYYYDSPVYDTYYPETTLYGVYDYPTYRYYPGYAYSVDIPVYMYPAGYEYAY